jgi:hypothetical protein
MNTQPLNTAELNSGTPLPEALTAADFDALEFDGYSLQSTEIISSEIYGFSGPSREIVRFATPRADGGGLISANFRERRIRASGILKAASSSALETLLDTFKRRLSIEEGNLDLKVNGEVRRIKATLANPETFCDRREGHHITTCPFDVEFLALEPMWKAIGYTTTTYEAVPTLAYSQSVSNAGTFKAKPVLVVIVDAASAITAFSFENTTNGEKIAVTTALASGDVLVIDSEEKSVTKNGTELDYDGIFPNLEYGDNTFTLTATGTSIQHTTTLKFKKTYI